MRRAALPPLVAFVLWLFYLAIFPLFPRVPAIVFWLIVAMLFAGTVAGAIAIARAARRDVLAWLAPAVVIELACTRVLLGMVFPWL